MSVLTGVGNKSVATLMDDFKGFKTSVEKVTCRCGKNRTTRIRSEA